MTGSSWDAAYEGAPPWDIGHPQPAFAGLAEAGEIRGRVLDVGCGTGEHAMMAAGLGLRAIGLDASRRAIDLARAKAEQRGLDVTFVVGDALDLGVLATRFDTVLDCGLFHVLDDDDRARYVRSLREAMAPGGRYVMLCFSDRMPGDLGPRRVRREEIRDSFAGGWRIESIEEATLEVTFRAEGVPAWLSVISAA